MSTFEPLGLNMMLIVGAVVLMLLVAAISIFIYNRQKNLQTTPRDTGPLVEPPTVAEANPPVESEVGTRGTA
jgi:hypothetical protein